MNAIWRKQLIEKKVHADYPKTTLTYLGTPLQQGDIVLFGLIQIKGASSFIITGSTSAGTKTVSANSSHYRIIAIVPMELKWYTVIRESDKMPLPVVEIDPDMEEYIKNKNRIRAYVTGTCKSMDLFQLNILNI